MDMFFTKYFIFFLSFFKLNGGKAINNIETLQYINNIKEETPVKIFIFFIKDSDFFENMKKFLMEDFLEIIKDISYFYNLNQSFLLLKPEKIELVNSQISRKLLLHNFNNLVGICMFVISFDGKYKKTIFIPGTKDPSKNLLFIIESNNIIIKNGILSDMEINKIIKKIKT